MLRGVERMNEGTYVITGDREGVHVGSVVDLSMRIDLEVGIRGIGDRSPVK